MRVFTCRIDAPRIDRSRFFANAQLRLAAFFVIGLRVISVAEPDPRKPRLVLSPLHPHLIRRRKGRTILTSLGPGLVVAVTAAAGQA